MPQRPQGAEHGQQIGHVEQADHGGPDLGLGHHLEVLIALDHRELDALAMMAKIAGLQAHVMAQAVGPGAHLSLCQL